MEEKSILIWLILSAISFDLNFLDEIIGINILYNVRNVA